MTNIAAGILAIILLDLPVTTETFSVSAYTDACGMPPWGITASGVQTRPGIVACGPDYPFGTGFIFPDHSLDICFDRGGKITNNHLDIWMNNRAAALEWGRQDVQAIVLPVQNFKVGGANSWK